MKILVVGFIIIFSVIQSVQGQYSIPAYNALVEYKADFQENNHDNCIGDITLSKREIKVGVKTIGFTMAYCKATVWVYSLDKETVYGPYTVYNDEILSVVIDQRKWGVFIECEEPVVADVWIE
jgi:hypothetical protein